VTQGLVPPKVHHGCVCILRISIVFCFLCVWYIAGLRGCSQDQAFECRFLRFDSCFFANYTCSLFACLACTHRLHVGCYRGITGKYRNHEVPQSIQQEVLAANRGNTDETHTPILRYSLYVLASLHSEKESHSIYHMWISCHLCYAKKSSSYLHTISWVPCKRWISVSNGYKNDATGVGKTDIVR